MRKNSIEENEISNSKTLGNVKNDKSSIELLKSAFLGMKNTDYWSMQLLQINSRKDGISYYSREIKLKPAGKIKTFADGLADKYLSSKGIESYAGVDEYTGDVVGNVIYKLQADNELIAAEHVKLLSCVSDPDTESQIETSKVSAYVILGEVQVGSEVMPMKLISMQSPFLKLSNRFLFDAEGEFTEIQQPILTLKRSIDAVILGDTVYLFTLAGENLFAMERAYKAVCKNKVTEIMECGFLTNAELFETVATSGQNPRRFVSYNQSRLDALKNARRRISLANKFGLSLNGTLIDTNDKKTAERLVKFLCNKAMLDPLDKSPVEVAAAKSWQ